jgi:hypothetical protein
VKLVRLIVEMKQSPCYDPATGRMEGRALCWSKLTTFAHIQPVIVVSTFIETGGAFVISLSPSGMRESPPIP